MNRLEKLIKMYKKGELGNSSNVQLIVIERWKELFKDTKYNPIDIHTPLWLWSRNGFKNL